MLAYVFWHWSAPGTPQSEYEGNLRAFHQALAANPAEGFHRSAAFRVEGTRWLSQPNAYEDWYLVDDFASLGTLNDAAVSGPRKAPHDDAARLAAGGTAGVYRLIGGEPKLESVRGAIWLSKPSDMSYEQFRAQQEAWTHDGKIALWQRQMTLGPTSEFCLQSSEDFGIANSWSPTPVRLTLVTW